MKEQTEKIGVRRLCANVIYVFRYAYQHDKKMGIAYITSQCTRCGVNTYLNTYLLKEVIDALSAGAMFGYIAYLLIIWFLISTVQVFISIWCDNLFEIRIVKLSGQIQRELMEKTRKIDLLCYDLPKYYDDFIIAASQSDTMVPKAVMSIANIMASLLSMVIAGTMIFTINPAAVVFPVAGFIVNIFVHFAIARQEYLFEIERTKVKRKADYSKRVFYQPEYAKEIKLTGIEEALLEQFDEAVKEEKAVSKKYMVKIGALHLLNWVFTFTLFQYFAVPVHLAYLAIVKKSIGLGAVASLKNATNNIKSYLDWMNHSLVDFQKVGQYAERFRRFMDYEIHIEGFEGLCEIPQSEAVLELKNVCFRYKEDEAYVLKDINMTIKRGEKIALVGENGAGKTTLIKLILRLYYVSEGCITYGGVDIRHLNTRKYREKIGAIFQDFQIYGASLAENIKMDFVKEEDRLKIQETLKRTGLEEKLEKLPAGIDTELTREFSENGIMLSGGEAQKAAIARIFIHDMPVAILDEPSSALDPVAEYRLNKSMMQGADRQAVILISHRLSTTKDADHIFLLENGCIMEDGTHKELLERNGVYARMWQVQAEKYCTQIYETRID